MKTASLPVSHYLDIAPNTRAAIVDALYRFAAGQDLRDRALFESAFAPGARLDFTQPAQRLGATLPVFEGRASIADIVFSTLRELDTTHTVTNPRVTAYDGTAATLFALVEAQHLVKQDHRRYLTLKNIYTVELSKRGGQWLIDHMKIENVWLTGETSVLFPGTA